MATKTDNDQQSAIDQGYSDGFDGGNSAYTSAGIDQLEAMANDPSQQSVKNAEENPGSTERNLTNALQDENNAINFTGTGSGSKGATRFEKALNFTRKRGGIIGIISALGIGGGILAGFFGPASLLINLTENFSLSNDSSSTAMERRLMKVFGNATKDSSTVCASSKKSMKCKMGKISNKALRALNKKGVVAIFDADSNGNGGKRYDGKRTGYPDKNPSHYEFDVGGTKQKVPAGELSDFLTKKENRKLAAQVLGRKGAFNMRVKAWAGKHITNKLYKKFGIERKGGAANGQKGTVAERRAAARAASLKPSDGTSRDAAVERATQKSMGKVKRAGKAGVGYLIAVASCVGIKVPSIVAAGVAAIQLAQLMPIAMDLVMSPGSKAKASGVDTENSISQEDMEALGMELTNKTENSEGKMTSALDSPYLLAAMGVNKAKTPVSKDFAPGYALLSSQFVKDMNRVNKELEPACNVIMSPAAMYTAMAVDMAVTVASSATIIGGVIKIVASWLIAEIAKAVTEDLIKKLAGDIFDAVAKNDLIPKAQGEQLGDVIGHSAAAIFASAGMARHLPTMTQGDVIAFNAIQQENESFHREMDIASLSPFDTSSRYTFLGSIVHNMRTSMIINGNYNNSIASTFANLIQLPSVMSPSTANAATGFTSEYCGYAEDYNLQAEVSSNSPAVNMLGMPCTGITSAQDRMSTEDAITLLENEGWICKQGGSVAELVGDDLPDWALDEIGDDKIDCPEISDGATIDELLENNSDEEECQDDKDLCSTGSGYIRKDTPLYDYIMNCSNPDTGDYVFNTGSCTVLDVEGTSGDVACSSSQTASDTQTDEETGEETETSTSVCNAAPDAQDSEVPDLKSARSMEAIAVFLLDYQILQSINGEDEEEGGSNSASVEGELVGDKAYPLPKGSAPANTYANHGGVDFPVAKGTPIFAVADGTVETAVDGCTQEHGGKGTQCQGTGWGNYVRIKHSDSVDTLYAHMTNATLTVKSGDTVKAGQQIGGVGSTGSSTGYHLHFEVYVNGTRIGDTGAFNWLKQYNILPIDQDSLNW